MDGGVGPRKRANSVALISYLPEPLAGFLDRLRRECVPNCSLKAHVTVLPPRPLQAGPEEAWRELEESLRDFRPFRVELGNVELFPETQVIYIEIADGLHDLERMHAVLNRGSVAFEEPFPYRPHITVAQELLLDHVPAALELAKRRWREFKGPHSFMVDRLTFVQNRDGEVWADLAALDLPKRVAS